MKRRASQAEWPPLDLHLVPILAVVLLGALTFTSRKNAPPMGLGKIGLILTVFGSAIGIMVVLPRGLISFDEGWRYVRRYIAWNTLFVVAVSLVGAGVLTSLIGVVRCLRGLL